eukprot:3146930-Pyramimonas_sp.AAC.1
MTVKLYKWQKLHGLRAGGFQNVALTSAPRTIGLNIARVSRIEGGGFQNVALALALLALVF